MPYNLLDPNQAQTFRQNALQQGYSIDEVDDYVLKRSKQLSDINKLQTAKTTSLSGVGEFERKMINAKFAADKALEILNTGAEVAGPITTPVSRVGEFFGKPSETTDYRSAINLASTQLFNALAGATQSEIEIERLAKLMPDDSEQEGTAKRKLTVLTQMLEEQMGRYGIDISAVSPQGMDTTQAVSAPPVLNISGDIADTGDLVRRSDGKFVIQGESNIKEMEKGFYKVDPLTGAKFDNSLVNFLSESSFLPVVGAVIGGLTSGPAGSAAGAMLGKSGQQAFREIEDPDRQTLGMAAKVVITEGITDAILSGLTLGVLSGGKMVLKKIGSKATGEVAEAVTKKALRGEDLLKAAKKGSTKTGMAKQLESMSKAELQKALKITPTQVEKFKKVWGVDPYDLIMTQGIPDSFSDMAKTGFKLKTTAANKLVSVLEKESASVDDVVKLLNEVKDEVTKNKKILPSAKAGVNQINKWIKYVKGFGKKIGGNELNEVKSGLQEVYGVSGKIAGASKSTVARASSSVRNMIENLPKDLQKDISVRGLNFEKAYGYFLNEMGEKAMTKERGKVLFDFVDSILLLKPDILLSKKMVNFFSNIDSLKAARLLQRASDIAAQKQSKPVLRNLLRLGQKSGLNFGIDPSLLTKSMSPAVVGLKTGASVMAPEFGQEQSSELGQPGMGMDLGNGFPTGVPYK